MTSVIPLSYKTKNYVINIQKLEKGAYILEYKEKDTIKSKLIFKI
mgnify:CR=1 FL=1